MEDIKQVMEDIKQACRFIWGRLQGHPFHIAGIGLLIVTGVLFPYLNKHLPLSFEEIVLLWVLYGIVFWRFFDLESLRGFKWISRGIVLVLSVVALVLRLQGNYVDPFYFIGITGLLCIPAFFSYSVSLVGGSITFFGKAIGISSFQSLKSRILVVFMLIIHLSPGLVIGKYMLRIVEVNDRIASRSCDIEVAIPYLDDYPIWEMLSGKNLQDKYYDQINDFNFPQVCVDKIFDFVYEDEIEDVVRGKEYGIVFAKSKDGYKAFYNIRDIIESFEIQANRAATAIYGFSVPAIQNIDFLHYRVPLYKGPSGKWIECKLGKQPLETARTTTEWMIDLFVEQRRQSTERYAPIDAYRLTEHLLTLKDSTFPDELRALRTAVYNSYSIITISNFLKSLRYQAASRPREINLAELRYVLGKRFFSFYLDNSPQTIEQQYDIDRIAAKLARYRALFFAEQHDMFLEEMQMDEDISFFEQVPLTRKELYGMKFIIHAARINYFKAMEPSPEAMKALLNMPACIEKKVNLRLLLSHWPEKFRYELYRLEASIKSEMTKMPAPEREQMEYLLEISELYERIFGNDPDALMVGEFETHARIGKIRLGEEPYMLNILILRELLAFSRYRLAELLDEPVYLIDSLERYWELCKSTRIPFLANFRSIVEDTKNNPEKYGVKQRVAMYLYDISHLLGDIPDSGPIPARIQERIDNLMAELRYSVRR